MFVYESLARRRSRAARTIGWWSKASGGRLSTGCQLVSGGHRGVDVARDEAEVGGRELPAERVAARVAARLELLEVSFRTLAITDQFAVLRPPTAGG